MKEIVISDAEWQVMNVIWDGQPMTAQEIISSLRDQAEWAPATIKTMLHRLVKKNVLTYTHQQNRYVYRAQIKRSDCVENASQTFLDRVFDGQLAPLLVHFLQTSNLSAEEIVELRRILDKPTPKNS